MKRESMVFYAGWFDAIRALPEKERLQCYEAILRYGLEGVDDCEGISKSILIIAKPQIDINNQRWVNSKQRGTKAEPKSNQTTTKSKPKSNQTTTKPLANVNVNVNDNVNANVNVNDINNTSQKKDERLVFVESLQDDWRELCTYWIRYKNERREHYKTAQSLQVFVKNLRKYSGENISVAREIIEQSMANNWAGIFPLKTPAKKMSNLVPLTENYEEDKKIGFQV